MNIQDVIAVLDQKGIKHCPLHLPLEEADQVVIWDTADILEIESSFSAYPSFTWTYFIRGKISSGTANKEFDFSSAEELSTLLDEHHVRKVV